MPKKTHINALTGARFFAIMVIVCSHFEFLYQYNIGNIYSLFFHNATMGVDFFFMLSGFGIMLSNIQKKSKSKTNNIKSLLDFSWAHVSEIYPLYIITLLIGIPYYMLISIIEEGKSFFHTVIFSVVKFAACLTLLQSSTGMMCFSHSLNAVCWFLSTLFCIHLVSPIVMKYLKRIVRNMRTAVIAIVIIIFSSYVSAILFERIDKRTIFDALCYVSPYRRIFYVICGMIIAQMYTFHQKFMKSAVLEYISIGSAMVWFFTRNSVSEHIGAFIYIVDMILCACVLYTLSFEKGKISRILASKTMVYLGNISIYIFITHYLIRMYVDFFVRQLSLESLTSAFVEIIVILGFTFLVSFILDRHYQTMKMNIKKIYEKFRNMVH